MNSNVNVNTDTATQTATQNAIAATVNADSTITVTTTAVSNAKYDELKIAASEQYKVGRDATYKAVAYAYAWYAIAKKDKSYIDAQFDKLGSNSNVYEYRNTVICCFKIKVDAQAATITKYAQAMKYIEQTIDFEISESNTETYVEKIVAAINYAGGLEACAKGYRATQLSNVVGLGKAAQKKQQKISDIANAYKRADALGEFKIDAAIDVTDSGLFVLIGRADAGNMKVVRIIANDDLVEQVIRKDDA